MAAASSYNSGSESNANAKANPTADQLISQEEEMLLSSGEILRVASTRIITMSSRSGSTIDLPSLMNNPFDLSPSGGLSYHDATKVELVEYLLAAAEKVCNRRHDQAAGLLDLCDCLSSETGDPIQRVVYHFSQSLRERIDHELGRVAPFGKRKRTSTTTSTTTAVNSDEEASMMMMMSLHAKIPFSQVSHLSAVQILLENFGNSRRIHVIDLHIGTGVHWTAMMQALASGWDRTVEIFKITVVGTSKRLNSMKETGRRLASFAGSLGIPFCFRIVTAADVLQLKPEMFDIDTREALAVYSEDYLSSLIPAPDHMEALMKLLRSFNPRVLVVLEMEANHNSVTFGHRFVEALFSYAAMFDCLDCCMDQAEDEESRRTAETVVLREAIRNIVVMEGEEREARKVRIDVWRTLFGRFSLVESKMSAVVLYHAKLILKRFSSRRFCKVRVDGKSLILGWKETPLISISSWKFARLRKHKQEASG